MRKQTTKPFIPSSNLLMAQVESAMARCDAGIATRRAVPTLQDVQGKAVAYGLSLTSDRALRAFIITLHETGAFGATDRDFLLGLV